MKKLFFPIISLVILSGCATDPAHQSRIDTCSREANAYSVSTRIGNSAYWSCLNRENARQTAVAQQQKINNLRDRCISFGLKTGSSALAQCVAQQQQLEIQAQQQQMINEQNRKQSNLDAYRTFTAPPPPMQIIQPGTVRGNDIRCSPDGSGGYNCR